jgi:hypothetical protein
MGPGWRRWAKVRAVRAPINPSVSNAALRGSELLGLGVEQPAGRTADAIGLGDCFNPVDCGSNARSWGLNRSTTSRRIKVRVASGPARAHARPGRSFRIHSEDTRCTIGVQRRGRPHFPVKDGFCIVFDKRKPKRKSSTTRTSAAFSGTAGWQGSITPRRPYRKDVSKGRSNMVTKSLSDFVRRRAEGGGIDRGNRLRPMSRCRGRRE